MSPPLDARRSFLAVPVSTCSPYQGGKMQRFVRSTIAGIVSAAALAACGDKVTVQNPPTPTTATPHITSVTVSGPTTYQLGSVTGTLADSLSYAATVVADAGFTGSRAVTWTSSNPSVFRITNT